MIKPNQRVTLTKEGRNQYADCFISPFGAPVLGTIKWITSHPEHNSQAMVISLGECSFIISPIIIQYMKIYAKVYEQIGDQYSIYDHIDDFVGQNAFWFDFKYLKLVDEITIIKQNGESFKSVVSPCFDIIVFEGTNPYKIVEISEDETIAYVDNV